MTKRLTFSCAMVLSVLATGERATARSVSAFAGRARFGQEINCFVLEDTGLATFQSLRSICDADFVIPLTTEGAGGRTLTFTARATATGASCRAVANDRFGSAVSASPFRGIPVSTTFESRTTAEVSVPGMGVFFADCITNSGTELVEFDYSP